MTIEALHQKFIHELPGEAAQDRMSPRPKHVEGEEGIHQGHPIHSAAVSYTHLTLPTNSRV